MIVSGRLRVSLRDVREGLYLIAEHGQDKLSIEARVIQVFGLQPPVLVALHKVMIGVPREGKRVEPERVDDRLLKKCQVDLCGFKMARIKGDEIMPRTKSAGLEKRSRPRNASARFPRL